MDYITGVCKHCGGNLTYVNCSDENICDTCKEQEKQKEMEEHIIETYYHG